MAAYNPFRALTPKQIRQRATNYTNAQFNPLIRQINQQAAQRKSQSDLAIQAATESLANYFGPQAGQTQARYDQAVQAAQHVNDAFAQRLANLGIQVGGGTATLGAGASAGAAGLGQNPIQMLIGQGANATNLAAQLPGIARLGGIYRQSAADTQIENQRASDVGKLQAQIPGAYQKELADLNNLEMQKNVAAQSGLYKQQQAANTQAYRKATIGIRKQGLAQTKQYHQQELNFQKQKDQFNQTYKLNQLGLQQDRYNLAVKHEAAYERTKRGQKGGLSQLQINAYRAKAHTAAVRLRNGVKNPKYDSTTPKGPTNPEWLQQPNGGAAVDRPVWAWKYIVNQGGIPLSIARQAVIDVYGVDPVKILKSGKAGTSGPRGY